ncbi:MAG: PAS domain S-box protein [Candidatus Hermodarchaeota archaeon]
MVARNNSEQSSSSRIFILCIDDEPDFLELTKIFLEKEDERLRVDTSTSVEEALKLLERKNYEAIVCDYQMPVMDGIQFLESLRNKNDLIPFIVLTGKSREEVAIKALNLGANRYLQKGGDPKALYGVLAQTIIQEVDHKRAERLVYESEKKYRSLAERAADGIAITQDNIIKYANQSLQDITEYSEDELLESDYTKYIYSDELPRIQEFVERMDELKQPQTFDTIIFTKKGKEKQVEINIGRITYQNKPATLTFVRDITERKKAEMALKETKNMYQMLIEKLEEGLTLEDPDGIITFVNPKTLESLGYTEEEIIGKHWSFIVPEKDLDKSYIETAKRSKGISSIYESSLLAKDGTFIPVIVTATPIISDTGEFQGVIVLSTDITERIQVERALKQSEEREKFFLTLLRHDIKNKIYIIRGYLDLLSKSELSEENKKLIEKALITSDKSHQLLEKVGMLRDIDQEDELVEINLDQFLIDAIEKNQHEIEENKIIIEYEEAAYKVLGGPLLEELFTNIIDNSIKHANCSKIKISCNQQNRRIVITLEDDGVGIPKKLRDNILTGEYSGEVSTDTGIGLLLIKRIAERYGGRITIKDSDLGGARIDIELNKA